MHPANSCYLGLIYGLQMLTGAHFFKLVIIAQFMVLATLLSSSDLIEVRSLALDLIGIWE